METPVKIKIEIESTPNYGSILSDTIEFDDKLFFGENLLNYKICKIKTWICKHQQHSYIGGIQFFYQEIKTKEMLNPGEYKHDKLTNYETEEFIIDDNESIINFIPSVDFNQNRITSIEIQTSMKRKFYSGGNNGEIKHNQLQKINAVIIGVFGGYGESGLHNIGVYYVNQKVYYSVIFCGLFYLRNLLKHNDDIKKDILNKIKEYSLENTAIIKACLLPSYLFLCVLKYVKV